MQQAATTLRDDSTPPGGSLPAWSVGFVILALLIWLTPFSLGTAMPVGGDATQFFLGLMATLSSALAERRLPVWNDLWGYGFPGVGESQIGAFYPPHVVLYGLLSVERAYVLSLVLHTLWAGLGACWAARVFGAGRLGAGLAGFVYAASGFFVIHMPHPWGYTTGSWTPWAWGLAWLILNGAARRHDQRPSPLEGEGGPKGRMRGGDPGGAASDSSSDPPRRSSLSSDRFAVCLPPPGGKTSERSHFRDALLLSAVLAIQVLPGHFQIAFMTQATVGMMAAWRLLETRSIRCIGLVMLALAVVLPMAAAQVWPTARLAGMAADRRDYEYLSGFAATPFHLISLVAPRLFHGSPLWRPLVWDPFHTSPEEYLAYVGIAPLFLALMTVRREWRREAAVRCLAVVAIVTLILSLGPYVPGFGWLIRLPGFSFFRAPARWGLPMSLSLAILAGIGVDRWRTWARPISGLLLGSAGALIGIGIVLGLIELGLMTTAPSAGRAAAGLFERAFALRPWEGDPDFRSVAALARRPTADPQIPAVLERAGFRRSNTPRDVRSFEQRRFEIYRDELWASLAILSAVLVAATLPRLRPHVPAILVLLTVVDLLLLGSHRYVEVGPLRSLAEQSPVLARLGREPRGTRLIDPMRNLGMAAAQAPVQAYRTLDLPAQTLLGNVARGSLDPGLNRDLALLAIRATGASLRVLDPIEVAAMQARGISPPQPYETIADPALARWLFGDDWNPDRLPWADSFQVLTTAEAPRAWSTTDSLPEEFNGDPRTVMGVLDTARPLAAKAPSPTEWEIHVDSPGTVMLSVLYDPQWRASLVSPNGSEDIANILPVFRVGKGGGAWIGVTWNPGAESGRVLRLRYDAIDVRQGLWASGACWTAWTLAILYAMRRERRGARPATV
ncbi:hypothetical protein [Paludisphaera rhizosphaerae]|uniref:hypothetical protein n=1 Tax=Paludisphaera rhizosphaerae TaxID=2711216 RepID=UPI0013EC77B7|nr:hypothetical protein [Paludisphaera rhizosphaerae]